MRPLLAEQLSAAGGDLSRRALEALGLQEYKSGRITKAVLRRLLGFTSRYELDGFLKAHDVLIDYTVDDFHRKIQDVTRLGLRRVRLVIADTSPINYLVLIGYMDILPSLFEKGDSAVFGSKRRSHKVFSFSRKRLTLSNAQISGTAR
jgi:hypothetical protein